MAAASSTWPPGVSPPLTVDVDDDHGGLVVVITSFCLSIVLAALSFRIYSWYINRFLQRDKYAFIATLVKQNRVDLRVWMGQVVAFAQLSVVLAEVRFGWGKTASLVLSSTRISMEKAAYAADMLYVSVLGLSRLTALVFYGDIFRRFWPWKLQAMTLWTVVGMIISFVILAVRCNPYPWEDISSEQCHTLGQRWQAITAIEIITEITLLLYPIQIISKLQLSRIKKLRVLSVIECRVMLIPVSVLHLHFVLIQINSSDPSLVGSFATLTAEIHLTVSVLLLISSSIKSVIAVYEDGECLAYTEDVPNSRSHSRTQNVSIGKSLFFGGHRIIRKTIREPSVSGWELPGDPILRSTNCTIEHDSLELAELSLAGDQQHSLE